MQGKSDLFLRHKVENDFDNVAPGIIGVNDQSALACLDQSLPDRG
jgi:hypothetical protein